MKPEAEGPAAAGPSQFALTTPLQSPPLRFPPHPIVTGGIAAPAAGRYFLANMSQALRTLLVVLSGLEAYEGFSYPSVQVQQHLLALGMSLRRRDSL